MKKRLLSLVLAAVMLLSLLPPAAFAAGAAPNAEDTPAGNLCRPSDGVTVTATASSQEADSVRPAFAIDGDTTSRSSRWGSNTDANAPNGGGTAWLRIDLGTTRQVGAVRIFWERLNVLSYRLEGSTDGTTWSTLYDSPNAITNVNETLDFNPVNIRYLRVNITRYKNTGLKGDGTESIAWNTVSLYEVEVYKDEASVPLDPMTVLNERTKAEVKNGKLVLTAQTEGQEFSYSFAANLEQVVGADGAVHTPLVNTQVELDVTVTSDDGTSVSTSPSQPFKVVIPGEHTANMGNPKPRVIPELMEWYSSAAQKGQNYTLTGSSKIVAPAALDGVARELKNDIKDLFGFELSIADTGAAAGDIVLVKDPGKASAGFDEETYLMEVSDRVAITATDAAGVYWGTRSVLQALKYSGNNTIAQGTARDYPEFKVRGFVLDVGRKPMSMGRLQEIVKNMAWYKLNDFHVHINDNLISMEDYKDNSESWNDDEVYQRADRAYAAFRLESDIQEESDANPLTAKDYYYTKAEYKGFVENSAKLGVNIVTEIDVPAHAKAITDAFPSLQLRGFRGNDPYAQNHPYNDHLDLSTEAKHNASVAKTQEIFDEYLDEGIFGSFVHFGADEYYASGTPYRRFVKDMITYLKGKKTSDPALADLTIRQWGSLSMMSSSEAGLTDADLKPITSGVQMNVWNTSWADPQQMYNLGFDLLNTVDGDLYIVPDAGYYFDYLNVNNLYNNWTPNKFGSTWIPASSSQMAGAAYAIWNDKIDTQANGIDEVEVYDRFAAALPYLSVKMWGEGAGLDRTVSEMQTDIAILGSAPGTNPYYQVESLDGLNNSFDSASELDLHNAEVRDGALVLKGGASYLETGLDYLGYNSNLTFTIKVEQAPAEGGQVIFESDRLGPDSSLAYNEYAIKALPVEGKTDKWKLGFSRELYDYEFATEFDLNQTYTLKLANERSALGTAASAASGTKLYVDSSTTGVPAVGAFLNKGEASNTDFEGKTGITKSYLQIPVARIGSKTNSFVGTIDNVSANSPVSVEPERPEEGTQLVNLALNKPIVAASSGKNTVNLVTDGDVRHSIDGAVNAWKPDQMVDTSNRNGPQTPQWFVVDLGEDVANMDLTAKSIAANYWRQGWPQKFKIQTTSDDPTSENAVWTDMVSIERTDRENGWIGSVGTTNLETHQQASRDVCGYALANSDVITADQMTSSGLKRYVRFYADEVQKDITQNEGKATLVIEFMVFARFPESESAGNVRAYQIADNQAYLRWDQAGTTYYQVYAKAPGGDWACISGDDVVNGNVFIHTGYTEGTVYRVLTPGSAVNSPVNTDTAAVDIRNSGDGYIYNTNTDRIAYSAGWSNWDGEPEGTYMGGSVQYCNSPTADLTAELTFIGTGIQLFGGKKNGGGRMTVEIDGVRAGIADYNNGSSAQHQQKIFELIGLDNGVHTIKLTGVAGTVVADANPTVEIEAFRVLVPAESIALSQSSLTIATGSTATNVTATVSPVNGCGEFEWTSSNPAAATVSGETAPGPQGRMYATITPVAGGAATITVKDKGNPEIKAELALTVTQPPANVILPDNQHSVTLYLNPGAGQSGTAALTPTVRPETATNKNVRYSSSAPGVATVNDSGVITAVAAGTATITVTTEEGQHTTTCAVTVKSNPTGIAVKDGQTAVTENDPLVLYTNGQGDLPAGKRNSAALTAELAPVGVTETDLTWNRTDGLAGGLISVVRSSTDPTRCTISVTGISETNVGEKTIEVKSTSNGDIKTTFKVRVLRYLVHDVTISVVQDQAPRPGATLEADINRLNLDDAGKAGLEYQWYRDGEPIPNADERTYILTNDDIEAAISVTVTATPTETYFYEGERLSTNTVTVGRNAPPAAPSLTMSPVDGAAKGAITIANPVAGAVYEISRDNGATWEDAVVEGGVIGGLEEGSYQVRVKATDICDAGLPAAITVTDVSKTYFTVNYTVTPDETGNVLLSDTSVEENGSVSAAVTPEPGYEIVSVTVGGEPLVGAQQDDGSMVYTVEDVAANVEFAVTLQKRQLTITHVLTNGLKCSKATTGADSHSVEYGTEEVITLVAEDGYTLPIGSGIEIKLDDGTVFTAFTYSQETGVITITGGVTENLTITAAGVARTYQVAYTNMSYVVGPSGEGERIATHGQDYTAKLTPATGYKLPAAITVRRGNVTLTAGIDYIYNPTTGDVTIKAAAVTGNLSISAAGERGLIPLEAVTISGTAQVGQRLTAQVSPEAAANDVNYQWIWVDEQGNESIIEGATGMSRVVTEISLNKRIAVRVTPDSDSAYTGSATSQPTAVVIAADAPIIPVSQLGITPAAVTVVVGSTTTLTAVVRPADATDQSVNWNSSNEDVASVDSAGVVTGLSVGTATITVATADGQHTAACTVNIIAKQVTPPQIGPGGGWITPPSSTTTVTENPDGSTTTTVTDNRTGTVTETTEKPDGSKEVVETKKDGTVTETTEKPDGATEVVETKPDGTVTATATDSEGGKVEKVTTPEKDVSITVTDPEGETLAKVEIPAVIPEPDEKFVDVPEGHWAEDAIYQAAGLKLVEGVGNGMFELDVNMKRGDLAHILFRMSNGNEGYEASFDDVPADKYYANSVAWAAAAGVVTGYSETAFGPENTITREQLAVMLYRYANLLKLDGDAASAGELDTFIDGASTSDWAVDGMAWCVKNGIIQGMGNDTLAPGINTTRAEVVLMLQRFMELMK